MNKKLLCIVAVLLMVCSAFSQTLDSDSSTVDVKKIQSIITIFKTGDKAKIASCFAFPFERTYPLTTIATEKEFIAKFSEVVDDNLIKEIASSSATADWAQIGWRGIMFKSGEFWINDDYKIYEVNYVTANGKKALSSAIAADKETLPKAQRTFEQPVRKWTVNGTTYRVDATGKDTYRFLLLDKKNKVKLELKNGTITGDGTGGNCYYTWHDAKKSTHIVYIDVMEGSAFYSVLDASNTDMDTMTDHIVQTLQ